MSKKGESTIWALLTYKLFLTIGPNCMIIKDLKGKWDFFFFIFFKGKLQSFYKL